MSRNNPPQPQVGNFYWDTQAFNQHSYNLPTDVDGTMELKQENINFFNNSLSNQGSNYPPHMYTTPINSDYASNGLPNQGSPGNVGVPQYNAYDMDSLNGVSGLGSESLSSFSSPSGYNNTSYPNNNNGAVPVPAALPNYSTQAFGNEEARVSPVNSVTGVESERPAATSKKSSFNSSSHGKSKKQILDEQDAILINRDDSELNEEELALKRKAQNRAAQRAFRERKETKLKDLEGKLLRSEEERQKLLEELEKIKQQNISIQTENQLLRSGNDANPHSIDLFARSAGDNLHNSKFTFPENQNEFIQSMMEGTGHAINQATVNKIYDEPENPGNKILAVGAVWDYIQIKAEEQELDVLEVMKRLRGNERCHGYGPAYPLDLVNQIISQVASGH